MSENPIIEDVEKVAETVGEDVVKVVEWVGSEIFTIGKAVFTAEEQVIMTKLGGILANDAVTIQNAQAGIDEKQLMGQLNANAESALVGLGLQLSATAIGATIAVVAKQVGALTSPGNAGTLQGGVQAPTPAGS